MPTGVEGYGSGYRATLHIRTCTFATLREAAEAREEIASAVKRIRIRQRIRKLEQTLSPEPATCG
jgi:hypothetical protein